MNLERSSLQAFAEALKTKGKQPSTIESYCRDAGHFLDFLAQNRLGPQLVEPKTLLDYQEHLSISGEDKENSIRRKVISVRQFYRFLSESKQIPSTPFDDVPIPERDDRLPKGLEEHQVDALIKQCRPESLKEARDRAIICLLAFEGLKANELIALEWGDYSPSAGTLKIRGPRSRTLELFSNSKEALHRYREACVLVRDDLATPDSNIFVSFKGKDGAAVIPQMTRHGLKFMLYELGEKASLPLLNTELLRHYSVTFQLAQGRSPETVMQHLGLRRLGNIAKHAATLPRQKNERKTRT